MSLISDISANLLISANSYLTTWTADPQIQMQDGMSKVFKNTIKNTFYTLLSKEPQLKDLSLKEIQAQLKKGLKEQSRIDHMYNKILKWETNWQPGITDFKTIENASVAKITNNAQHYFSIKNRNNYPEAYSTRRVFKQHLEKAQLYHSKVFTDFKTTFKETLKSSFEDKDLMRITKILEKIETLNIPDHGILLDNLALSYPEKEENEYSLSGNPLLDSKNVR